MNSTSVTISTTSLTTSVSSSRTSTSSSTTAVTILTSSGTTSTVSTTTITTTTIRTNCGSSCVNRTWISSSNTLAKWLFDDSFADIRMLRNETARNSPSFLTRYVNQSVFFNVSLNQSVISNHLPLSNTSFTITLWFNITGYLNLVDHGILGVCSATLPNQCLFISIRGNSSTYRIYMSCFVQACQGTTDILVNQWYHVGFVFDMNTMTQSIYLNGEIDQLCPVVSPLTLAASSPTSIGYVPLLVPITDTHFFHPQTLSGAVIHLSSAKDGRDWSGGIKVIMMNDLLPVQSWSFIVQTWGPINGLRLYVNSTLAASNSTLTGYSASGVPMYLFLGSGGAGLFHCTRGAMPFKRPFAGAVNDLRVYSRDLTAADICNIRNS